MSKNVALSGTPKVCVVGLGYIGLPTAAFFAHAGAEVIGVDVNADHVRQINSGIVPFVEPGFDEFLGEAVRSGKLTADVKPDSADIFIIAVPTPFAEHHKVDMRFINSAVRSIADKLVPGNLIVLESTSPPGTTQAVADLILELRPELSLDPNSENHVMFAHCPERVLPGRIMAEMVTNDRIVGGLTPAASKRAAQVYSMFCDGEILQTTAATAELAKLTENAFRDVNIAFANELSLIAEKVGVDVWELIELANHHPRVNILSPGPGVGGHCIAVDPWFIVSSDPDNSRLIKTARLVNDSKPGMIVEKTLAAVEAVDSPTIAALGLSFKANIDDLRESPAVEIVSLLSSRLHDGRILVVEPHINSLPQQLSSLSNVQLAHAKEAIQHADIVVLLVDHDQFAALPNPAENGIPVIDSRGMWR